jgi:flavin-dependent dehydrogenase
VHTLRVRRAGRVGEHSVTPPSPPLGVVVWRATFDEALAREAVRRGATLLEGMRLTALETADHKHNLTMQSFTGEKRSLCARLVVGADGSGSAVRRLSGMPERGPRARLIVAETEAVAGDDVLREGRGVLEFDLDVLDAGIDGYVWHFATTIDGRAAVSRGVYDWRGRRGGDAQALRAELDRLLRARGLPLTGIKPYTERVFVDGRGALALRSGVLLVGEAAGLVDPVTGEGIAQALASGRIAAEEIVLALRSAVDPQRYHAAIASVRFHRHLRQTSALAKLVYGRRGQLWAEALASTPSAMMAGADWYAGTRLGTVRKARVGVALAASLAAAGVRRARG